MVVWNWLPIAAADGFEKLNELSISVLFDTEVDNGFDDCRGNLHFKQSFVVVNEGNDRVFCANVVDLVCVHGVFEVQVYPLRHVQLVLVVVLADALYQSVGMLGHLGYDVCLNQLL